MICKMCHNIPTTNPDHICGICHLRGVLNEYMGTQESKEFVKNMPVGAQESSKAEFLDWR